MFKLLPIICTDKLRASFLAKVQLLCWLDYDDPCLSASGCREPGKGRQMGLPNSGRKRKCKSRMVQWSALYYLMETATLSFLSRRLGWQEMIIQSLCLLFLQSFVAVLRGHLYDSKLHDSLFASTLTGTATQAGKVYGWSHGHKDFSRVVTVSWLKVLGDRNPSPLFPVATGIHEVTL